MLFCINKNQKSDSPAKSHKRTASKIQTSKSEFKLHIEMQQKKDHTRKGQQTMILPELL